MRTLRTLTVGVMACLAAGACTSRTTTTGSATTLASGTASVASSDATTAPVSSPSPIVISPSPGPTHHHRKNSPPPLEGDRPPGLRLAVAIPGPIGPIVVSEGVLFAVEAVGRSSNRIVRWDPASGAMVRSAPFRGGHELAVAGGSVWATSTTRWLARAGGAFLLRFDARTLRSQPRVALPARPASIAVSSAGVWVAAGSELDLVDPAAGRVRSRFPIRGRGVEIAVDPTGTRLYVAATPPKFVDSEPLVERDAVTGALLRVAPQPCCGYPANLLAPTRGGVWVSSATGMFGAAIFLRASDLERAGRDFEGYQGVAASFADRRLWLLDGPPSYIQLACADPLTGGRTPLAIPGALVGGNGDFSNVVGVGDSLFVGTGAGILRMSGDTCQT